MELNDNNNAAIVLESAIQMEKDGIEFYSKAASKIDNKLGSELFLSLVEDEKRHLKYLSDVATDLVLSDIGINSIKALSDKITTIFSNIPDEIKASLKSNPEDEEILEIAIKMEEEGIRYYTEKCVTLGGQAGELCTKIIEEEKNHRKIIENTLQYLKNNQSWNLETENWMFEG